MSGRDMAVLVVVVLAAMIGVGTAVEWAVSRTHSGEESPQATMVAQKVANDVDAALACNATGTFSQAQTSWTLDGYQVTAKARTGNLDVTVTIGSRAYSYVEPLGTSCQDSGSTITAAGAQ